MEEEDDDFYDPTDAVPSTQVQNNSQNAPSNGQEVGDAEEEEIEVEDDEVCLGFVICQLLRLIFRFVQDDFNIITEAPPDAPPPEM